MDSDWLKEHLVDAVEGTLEEQDQKRLHDAFSEVPELESRVRDFRRIVELVRKAPTLEEPGDFTARVMSGLEGVRHPWWIRAWSFLVRPREIRINLLGALSGSALLALSLLVAVHLFGAGGKAQMDSSQKREYVVRFTYSDPQARHVYVAGSFNNWQTHQLPLVDRTGRGVWVALVPIKPGSYEYMFLVDEKWVPDTFAQNYKDDGFGRKNAVLNVSEIDEVKT
jgi:anti-sigma factor RsiW